LPLPTGMVRAARTRSRIEYYAEGWPEGEGPTWGIAKRNPSGRKPGRPKQPLREKLKLIVLRARMKTYETQGSKREGAVLAAMADLNWPKRAKAAEIKRVLLDMRRSDKVEQAEAEAEQVKAEAKLAKAKARHAKAEAKRSKAEAKLAAPMN
jgi:hypothetical protein